ncbi:MAG TPA: polysaccharide ABC transporter ATP-binding protein [Gemmatimonadales bacterium]|nr:polysaccharide ABC transporter ATP-binding protein [Gemmatimonadales bacterium]
MTAVALRVEELGKRYRISRLERYRTFRDVIARTAAAPFRRLGRGPARAEAANEDLWALRDLSFEVPRGQVLGVIGRNGAGKSTLLKILARIVEPTVGRAEIHGRVGSLLEVGTGFHPELSGRENIFLNGAILGMRRAEIARKFDEIVAFAETERFLDTPVKHYSSGMHMRLAFAVAAHLETQVLLVDEVLAVGDAAFQRKCLGKMSSVAHSGRTVLFVSHHLEAVQHLCSRCLLMVGGRLHTDGPSADVVSAYLSGVSGRFRPTAWIDLSAVHRMGSGEAAFVAVQYASDLASVDHQPYTDGPIEFTLLIRSDHRRTVAGLAVTIYNQLGTKLVNADSGELEHSVTLAAGLNRVRVRLSRLHLSPGVYRVGFWLADPIRARTASDAYDYIETAFEIEVIGVGPQPGRNAQGPVPCVFSMGEAEPVDSWP